MMERVFTVQNKLGLHARPAALFVGLVEKFDVVVTISNGQETVNGKSIMGILMLGAVGGTLLKIIIEGPQAPEAMMACEKFFSQQEEELG